MNYAMETKTAESSGSGTATKKTSPTKNKRKRSAKNKFSGYDGRAMKLENFLAWEPEAGIYKFEWNQGLIEARERTMKNTERTMVMYILKAFSKTEYFTEGGGMFPETQCYFEELDRVRIPDLAYFSSEQLSASDKGKNPIPSFVIEITSPSDRSNRMMAKMREYFEVGVQVVWHIHPEFKEVQIYTSPKTITVCSGDDICSAAPAIPDLKFPTKNLFPVIEVSEEKEDL